MAYLAHLACRFEEGRELEKRMAGLSDLVAKYQPDILMFQVGKPR